MSRAAKVVEGNKTLSQDELGMVTTAYQWAQYITKDLYLCLREEERDVRWQHEEALGAGGRAKSQGM